MHSTAWGELGCGHNYRSTMQEIGTEEGVGVYYMVDIFYDMYMYYVFHLHAQLVLVHQE